MNDTKRWPALAGERLAQAPQSGKIIKLYTGLTLGLALLVSLVVYALDLSIAQTSGLGDMGKRTFLSTLQTLLPMGQSLFLLCLDLGFVAAMLRVGRGQFVSPQTLRLGFDRFWVLVRSTLLQAGVYVLVCVPVAYLALAIAMLTPLGDSMVEAMIPLMRQATVTTEDATLMMEAMGPCIAVCCCAIAIAMWLLSYRYRMVNYILIDKPDTGALAAMRESRRMMKGNHGKLLRLDLRLWWYYAALALCTAVGYLDQILPGLGISLPLSSEASYYVASILSMLLLSLTYLSLRGRVEVAYSFAYDALKPKEAPTQGVVLGNIFQM